MRGDEGVLGCVFMCVWEGGRLCVMRCDLGGWGGGNFVEWSVLVWKGNWGRESWGMGYTLMNMFNRGFSFAERATKGRVSIFYLQKLTNFREFYEQKLFENFVKKWILMVNNRFLIVYNNRLQSFKNYENRLYGFSCLLI